MVMIPCLPSHSIEPWLPPVSLARTQTQVSEPELIDRCVGLVPTNGVVLTKPINRLIPMVQNNLRRGFNPPDAKIHYLFGADGGRLGPQSSRIFRKICDSRSATVTRTPARTLSATQTRRKWKTRPPKLFRSFMMMRSRLMGDCRRPGTCETKTDQKAERGFADI
jgi:hypothetical protein